MTQRHSRLTGSKKINTITMSSSQSAEAKKTEKGFLVTDCVTRDKCQHMEMRRRDTHNISRDKQQHKTSLFQLQKALKNWVLFSFL